MTRSTCVLSALLLTTACGDDSADSAPGGVQKQASFEIRFDAPAAEVLVAVVDDRPDASALRMAVATEFSTLDAKRDAASCRADDPAAFHPVDRSVMIAHPSIEHESRLASPLTHPALRLQAVHRTAEAHARWAQAVAEALEPPAGFPITEFRALDAFERIATLLSAQRAPQTVREAALVASLPAEPEFALALAVAHEDESPQPPALYAFRSPSAASLPVSALVLPDQVTDAEPIACNVQSGAPTARYAEWLSAQAAETEPQLWPCAGLTLFPILQPACTFRCFSWQPETEPDGRAACILLIDTPRTAPCDGRFGWLDPQGDDGVRRPLLSDTEEGPRRTCEIRQLEGAALESCRTRLDCADCGPGFCLTEVSELQRSCPAGHNYFSLRLVLGADVAAPGSARMICSVAKPAP